ncbi:WD40-repeat-containing domain protein [Phakopsora pachyrhizi]|uniref:WD40-repeat-containing domain protein n=1 Tax=Phakopsora pachyrhizi TaxID=170000 RepID=A0AAV0B5H9_PHAPC|nr:WD40-repeat-containing domain protein [Phakopsora pachyrhizi]CAH7682282.1 WD40-repeat-containing domain protein [Phakopsora pachyrhizi]
MTMHLLHGQISSLEERSSSNVKQIEELKKMNGSLVAQLERAKSNVQVESKFRGNTTVEVFKNSSDLELSRYFKSISTKSRLHLLHVLLESALPGDLSSLIKYLTKIEKSKRDFINQLPENLAIRCLLKLDLRSILSCRLWDEIITRSGKELWRTLCLSLTSMDDEPPRPKRDDSESWFELYQGLYHREENWRLGLAQRVVVLKGHTGSIGALKLRGTTLVTGSLDGTLRIWNIRLNSCLKIVKMPTPVSSLDFFGQYGPGGVIAAGGNDIGRVFLISMSGNILSTLSGHNKGIRTLAMNSEYLVTGGYDKALVVWNWKQGTRIVKFGQQTNPCAAISLFGSSFSSVQVDGVIRCFNILTRELVSQHKVQQWFVAEARRVIIATKTTIYQLEYNLSKEDNYSIDLSSTPRLISITPILHELNSGTIDILKRRFAASPRFATRLGENMRIFLGHLPESEGDYLNSLEERKERRRSRRRESYENQAKSFYDDSVRDVEEDDYEDDGLQPIEGAWLDAESFVSSRNPTVMSLSSDQLVVGCSDGLLYGLDFCGNIYKRKSNNGGIKSDGGD